MLVAFPNPNGNLIEGDLIALTRDGVHIGYGTVEIVLEEKVLVKVDSKSAKTFNELYLEDIPFDSDIIT